MHAVRPCAVAGSFYPDQPRTLTSTLASLLAEARAHAPTAAQEGAPKVLIVPHAGYIYSGAMAARAYSQLEPWRAQIRRVVLLGPAHRLAVRGLALPGVEAFATPLGEVPIDAESEATLRALPQVAVNAAAHAQEHALEVQLPFLQATLDDFRLLPLAVGAATPQQVGEVLQALWGGPETLIVISTDLSHYLTHTEASRVDKATVEQILAGGGPVSHEQACGATVLNGLLPMVRGHDLRAQSLGVCNSGDTAGDRHRVVGYAAIAFHEPAAHVTH